MTFVSPAKTEKSFRRERSFIIP